MPIYTSNLPPKINAGAGGGAAWLQKGLKYGINESGPFQSFSIEGTSQEVEDMALFFQVGGWIYTVERLGAGMSRIDAHAGWNNGSSGQIYSPETPEDVWELDGADEEKGILEADFDHSSLVFSSPATRDALSKIIEVNGYSWYTSTNPNGGGIVYSQGGQITYNFDGGSNPHNTDGTLVDPSTYHLPVADYAPAHTLFLFMKQGVTSFPVEATVIRHTQIVSNLYATVASFVNVRRIISATSMTNIENVPTDLMFGIPVPPTPQQYIQVPGDLQYGWRKSRPNVERLTRFKWRIVQTWQFGLWAIPLFGPVL